MVYLQSFAFPTASREEDFFIYDQKAKRTCYDSKYPFLLFKYRELPEFCFDDITIFYGDNGSGKSTILNVIAEKLALKRSAPYNRTDFFEDYVGLCDYTLDRSVPDGSEIITSDGVFERVLDIRRLNDGIDDKRQHMIEEYIEEYSKATSGERNPLTGLDDFRRWKKASDMRNKNITQSRFLRRNLVRNVQERSNGESALAYFVDAIRDDALYLLDEPENSLSPEKQCALADYIVESARSFGCQFILSTHSIFLLAMKRAKIYDFDEQPVDVKPWQEVKGAQVYRDFFRKHEGDLLDFS